MSTVLSRFHESRLTRFTLARSQTYTSQAEIKRGNRFLEKALRDLEYYGSLASIHSSSYEFPKCVFARARLPARILIDRGRT